MFKSRKVIVGMVMVFLAIIISSPYNVFADPQLDLIELKVKKNNKILKGNAACPKLMDGRFQIKQTASTTFPIIIDQPGSYVLTSNLNVSATDVNCIEIDTNNVTLDLNGNAIIGPGSGSGNGIYSATNNNISVINGIIRDFGSFGICLSGLASNRQVKDIKAYKNGITGILVHHATIRDCISNHNGGDGIALTYSSMINSVANYNNMRGIHASEHCSVTNCTSLGNGSHGIYTPIYSSTITNCTSTDNNGHGIYIQSSIILNCTASRNSLDGIYSLNKCRIEGCNLRDNGRYGLYLSGSDNYAIQNVASDNGSGNFFGSVSNYMPLTGDNANYGF